MPPSGKTQLKRREKWSFWVWPAYFLALWQILLWAQNPGLMADDSGEMAASAFNLGLPHPPGYPLFNLLGHLVSQIPFGAIAFRLNLFSAFLTLFSLFLTLDAARRMDDLFEKTLPQNNFKREVLLAAMGLVLISFRGIFAQSLTAKGCIYTLTLLFTSAAVWLYVFQQKNPQDRRPFLAGCFLWAVGLANHWQTLVLWIPFLQVWFFQQRRFSKAKVFLSAACLGVIGLSLYLYLPLRAQLNCQPCWGYPIHLPLFYWVVSRQLVAGVEHWVQSPAFYLESAREIGRVFSEDWLPGFAVLSLGGMAFLWNRNRNLFYGLTALWVPIFLGIFAVHEEYNTYLVPAYFVCLAGIAILFGFAAIKWISQIFQAPRTPLILAVLLGLYSAGWLACVAKIEDKSTYLLSEDFGTNVLKGLPKGAIFLADGDHYVMPMWYGHFAQGKRPDLIFEPSVFLYHGWGWKQLGDQSEDLKPWVASSNLLQEKLNALIQDPKHHPLFRSMGTEFLGSAFDQMPGVWMPRGLAYAWEPRRLSPREELLMTSRIIAGERLRSLEDFRVSTELDFSSQQIYRYYADQLTALKQ